MNVYDCCHSVNYDTSNAMLTLFKMSLLWQLDNQEIITSPTCSNLLEVRGNINDTVVKAFYRVITLNEIFITIQCVPSKIYMSHVMSCACAYMSWFHSYNGVMTTRVKTNHNIWQGQGNVMLTQS